MSTNIQQRTVMPGSATGVARAVSRWLTLAGFTRADYKQRRDGFGVHRVGFSNEVSVYWTTFGSPSLARQQYARLQERTMCAVLRERHDVPFNSIGWIPCERS